MYKKIILLIAVLTLFNINISSAQKVIPPYKMMGHRVVHRNNSNFFDQGKMQLYIDWEITRERPIIVQNSKEYYKYMEMKEHVLYCSKLNESNIKSKIKISADECYEKFTALSTESKTLSGSNENIVPFLECYQSILMDCYAKLNMKNQYHDIRRKDVNDHVINGKCHGFWGYATTSDGCYSFCYGNYFSGKHACFVDTTMEKLKKDFAEPDWACAFIYSDYDSIYYTTLYGAADFGVQCCDWKFDSLKKTYKNNVITELEYEEAMFYYTLLKVHCLNEANRYNEAKDELKKIEYYDKETKYDIENLNLTYPRIMYYLAKGITEYNSGTMYKDKEDELVLLYNYILRVKEECGPENPFNPDYCYMNQNILIVVSDYIEWLNQYGIQGYKDSSNRIKLKLINEGYEIM